jgi:hypothetical protein
MCRPCDRQALWSLPDRKGYRQVCTFTIIPTIPLRRDAGCFQQTACHPRGPAPAGEGRRGRRHAPAAPPASPGRSPTRSRSCSRTISAKPMASAAAASASASVRPPALSSLMFTASYFPTSPASEARSCTLSSAHTGIARAAVASAASAAAGRRGSRPPPRRPRDWRRSSPRAIPHWHRRSVRHGAPPGAPRRCDRGRHRPRELDLQQGPRRRGRGGGGHGIGRPQRVRWIEPQAFVGRSPAKLGFEIDEGAIERIASRARGQVRRAPRSPPRPRPRSRHSGHRACTRRDRKCRRRKSPRRPPPPRSSSRG